MDGFIEEPLASALGGFAIAGILFDVGDHPRIENALAIRSGVKAAIEIEISPSEVQPDLFGHLLQRLGDVLIQLMSCYHVSTKTAAPSWRSTMAFVQVQCPDCYSTDVVQYGKQANGTQRYRCHNRDCPRTIFLLQYQDKGRLPAVRQQIVDMTLNGSGVRDIVRVLRVSSATVIDVLKKKEPAVKQVHERLLHTLDPPQVHVILRQVEARL